MDHLVHAMDLSTRTPITSSNYGPVVSIISWTLLAAVILCSVLKWIIAYVYLNLSWDDACIFGAVLFSIAQTVATSIQVSNGVGRHINSLTTTQINSYQETGYAAELFYILVFTFTKLSTVAFVRIISPRKQDLQASFVIGTFTVVWSLSSFLAVAFQCGLPDAWQILGGTCIDQESFWLAYSIINIITEIALIVLPCVVVSTACLQWKTKRISIAVFHARLLTIAAIIVQIVIAHIRDGGSDPTYNNWPTILCQNVAQSVAVVTVCIPYIRGMLIGMESGMLQIGHMYHPKDSVAS